MQASEIVSPTALENLVIRREKGAWVVRGWQRFIKALEFTWLVGAVSGTRLHPCFDLTTIIANCNDLPNTAKSYAYACEPRHNQSFLDVFNASRFHLTSRI